MIEQKIMSPADLQMHDVAVLARRASEGTQRIEIQRGVSRQCSLRPWRFGNRKHNSLEGAAPIVRFQPVSVKKSAQVMSAAFARELGFDFSERQTIDHVGFCQPAFARDTDAEPQIL